MEKPASRRAFSLSNKFMVIPLPRNGHEPAQFYVLDQYCFIIFFSNSADEQLIKLSLH